MAADPYDPNTPIQFMVNVPSAPGMNDSTWRPWTGEGAWGIGKDEPGAVPWNMGGPGAPLGAPMYPGAQQTGTTKPMQSGAVGAAGGMGAMGTGSMPGQNPYLQQMGDVMAGQMTQNFNRNVMPGISSQMMATGGYGGSRQGVIEANAMNDLNGQIGNALTNLYGQGYNTSLQYDLGLRNNDLGFAGLDSQIAQNNFNNRLNGANFGLGVFNQGMANNQTGINAGTNIQNTPMNYWSQFANQFNGIGQGYGSTTGSTSQQGNPVLGALGGAQLGGRIANGWGGNVGGTSAATQGWTYGGSGTNRGPSDNIDWIYGGG